MYGFNASAAFVWQTLETFDDLTDMLRAMGAAGDEAAIGAGDLEAFLQELSGSGLIEQAEPEVQRPHSPAQRHSAARRPVGRRPADRRTPALEPPTIPEPPRIVWQETVEQIAATCAFFPAQNPLCNQVPFS